MNKEFLEWLENEEKYYSGLVENNFTSNNDDFYRLDTLRDIKDKYLETHTLDLDAVEIERHESNQFQKFMKDKNFKILDSIIMFFKNIDGEYECSKTNFTVKELKAVVCAMEDRVDE